MAGKVGKVRRNAKTGGSCSGVRGPACSRAKSWLAGGRAGGPGSPIAAVGGGAVVPQRAQRPSVGGAAEMEEEVGVEPCGHGQCRVTPFGQEDRVWVRAVEPGADLAPQPGGFGATRVVFHQ